MGQEDPLAEPEPDPNLVPFECKPDVPELGPRRIARLSAAQFGPSLQAVFDALDLSMPKGIAPPFDYVNPADRFSTFARSYGMNDAEMQSVWEMASFVADTMASQLAAEEACLADVAGRAACFTSIAERAASAAYRRPLAADEAAALAQLGLDMVSQIGVTEALATFLQRILMAPEFLFRSELGVAAAGGGSTSLSPHERAAAVSYALESRPPESALVAAAMQGPEALGAEVVRRLAEPAKVASVPLMLREYFRYPGAVNVFKDPEVLPDGHRVDLVKDTDTLVTKVLEARAHQEFFKALLTWPEVWVSQDTHEWYGITQETSTHEKQLRTPPAGTRLGILTQPSFLIYYSDMQETRPVQRGRFVLESLLCTTVPELPIGTVPPLPDLGEDATQRERLAVHSSQPGCAGCHVLMDPLGLAFEQFDHYGRFRTTEGQVPIDASGELMRSIDQDGPFSGVLELIQKLSDSAAAEQCFVRHSFRYWLGRNERDGDGCALVQARDAYQSSGGDYAALVAALFSSAPFNERAANEGVE